MNKKFRAFYRPDFDTPDGPLEFKQVEINDSLFFQHVFNEGNDELLYDFQTPFLDNDWIVQQWTNLIDMKGVEIYEGDIVEVGGPRNLFEVNFGKVDRNVLAHDQSKLWWVELNGFYFEHLETKLPCFSIIENEFGSHDLTLTKVIGNIFAGYGT